MKNIWNSGVRKLLYIKLVQLFGPYNKWESRSYPRKEDKQKYQNFLQSFAEIVGAKSSKAVENQIAWAVTKQDNPKNYTYVMFSNKCMAYEAGFIDGSYIPSEVTIKYKESNPDEPAPLDNPDSSDILPIDEGTQETEDNPIG